MQSQEKLFYTPASRSASIVDDLVSHDPETRNQAAVRYRQWIERKYQNADAQEYSKINDEVFQLLTRLSRDTMAVVDQRVDLGYQEEDRNIRISQNLDMMIHGSYSDTMLEPLATVGLSCLIHGRRHWDISCVSATPIFRISSNRPSLIRSETSSPQKTNTNASWLSSFSRKWRTTLRPTSTSTFKHSGV